MPAAIPVEQAALLGAIVAHPEEDTPRLVYADWLQENGDAEQAAYIRDAIKLARMKPEGEPWEGFAKRLREVAYKHGDDWVEALGIVCTTDQFDRGLPLRVTFEGSEEFRAAGDAVFALLPIRGLRIVAFGDSELDDADVGRLAETPALARLTDLRLVDHPRVNYAAWEALFRSPHLSELRYLSLHGCGVGEEVATAIAHAPALAGLVDLDLSHNSIGNDGARALFDSPHLTQLKRLWLEDNFHISDEVRDLLRVWLEDELFLHSSPEYDEEGAS